MSAIETTGAPVAASPLPGLINDLRSKGEDLKRSHELTKAILGEIQALLNGVGAVVTGSTLDAVDAKAFIGRAAQMLSVDPHAGQMDASLFQAINAIEAYRRTQSTGKA